MGGASPWPAAVTSKSDEPPCPVDECQNNDSILAYFVDKPVDAFHENLANGGIVGFGDNSAAQRKSSQGTRC